MPTAARASDAPCMGVASFVGQDLAELRGGLAQHLAHSWLVYTGKSRKVNSN